MLETLGIVQLNSDAASHKGKDSDPRVTLAGKSMLEWIVRRVTDAQRLDGVIVVASSSPRDLLLAEEVPADVPVLTSSAAGRLSATVEAIEKYPCESIVLVGTDTPFVDPGLIDRLVITSQEQESCDYVSYQLRDGRPSVLSQIGVFAEWCCSKAIMRADRRAKESGDRTSVTRYIYSHPEEFQIRLLAAPAALDRDDLRLRVSCEEDLDLAATIVDALGQDALEWQSIAGLLAAQPQLRQRMALLNEESLAAG